MSCCRRRREAPKGAAASDRKALGMPSRLQSELLVVQGCPLLAIEWTAIAIDQNEEPHTCMDLSRGAGREHMSGTDAVFVRSWRVLQL